MSESSDNCSWSHLISGTSIVQSAVARLVVYSEFFVLLVNADPFPDNGLIMKYCEMSLSSLHPPSCSTSKQLSFLNSFSARRLDTLIASLGFIMLRDSQLSSALKLRVSTTRDFSPDTSKFTGRLSDFSLLSGLSLYLSRCSTLGCKISCL